MARGQTPGHEDREASAAPDSRRSPERDSNPSSKANVSVQRTSSKSSDKHKGLDIVGTMEGTFNPFPNDAQPHHKPASPKKSSLSSDKGKNSTSPKKAGVKSGRIEKSKLETTLKPCTGTTKTGPTGRPVRNRKAPVRFSYDDLPPPAPTPTPKPKSKPVKKAATKKATPKKSTKKATTPKKKKATTTKKKSTTKKPPAKKATSKPKPKPKSKTKAKKVSDADPPPPPAPAPPAPVPKPHPHPDKPKKDHQHSANNSRSNSNSKSNNSNSNSSDAPPQPTGPTRQVRQVSVDQIPGILAPSVWENRPPGGGCG